MQFSLKRTHKCKDYIFLKINETKTNTQCSSSQRRLGSTAPQALIFAPAKTCATGRFALKPAAQWIPACAGMTPLSRRLGRLFKTNTTCALAQSIKKCAFACVLLLAGFYPQNNSFAGTVVTGSPSTSGLSNVVLYPSSSAPTCFKESSSGACYYCGSSTACAADCVSKTAVNAGSYSSLSGYTIMGCLGSSFCLGPGNGLLISYISDDSGSYTNTFITSYVMNTCYNAFGPQTCATWNSTAYNYGGYPLCSCSSVSSSVLQSCSECNSGYYNLSNNSCTRCPSMTDSGGTVRYGSCSNCRNNSDATGCIMSTAYQFNDGPGDYNFTTACNYSN